MKKAQSMPLNVIIIAVIVVVVAVVLLVIFNRSISSTSKELSGCSLRGGTCKAECLSNEAVFEDTNCPENQKCCVKVFESES